MVKKLLAAFSLSVCSIGSTSAVGITNGGFESGNLHGWSVFMFDQYNERSHATPDQWA
jgi:hypothetical protein